MNPLRKFTRNRPQGLLYHYTTAAGLLGILNDRAIWATSMYHLNDAKEFKHARNLLAARVKRSKTPDPLWAYLLDPTEDFKIVSDVLSYVVSFSTNGNQLSQWRAYCKGGNGFSIGFDLSNLTYAISASGHILVNCIYEQSEHEEIIEAVISYMERVFQCFRGMKEFKDIRFLIRCWARANAVMLAIKDKGFNEEAEWRLVGFGGDLPRMYRTGRFGIVPYRAIPLCKREEQPKLAEIVIGPNLDPVLAKDAVVRLCADKLAWSYTDSKVQLEIQRFHIVRSSLFCPHYFNLYLFGESADVIRHAHSRKR